MAGAAYPTRLQGVLAFAIAAMVGLAPGAAALDLVSPSAGDYLSGSATVEWQDKDDEDRYNLTLFASGTELEPKLCEGCPGFTFTFDTTEYADGTEYVLELDDTDPSASDSDDDAVTPDGPFTIDNTPPSTLSRTDGDTGEDGWFVSDVLVDLEASDETAGVSKTVYSIDGGSQQVYDRTIRVSGDGVHRVEFHSVDRAGNAELVNELKLPIDATDPLSSAEVGEPSVDREGVVHLTSDTEVRLAASDATSGVDRIEWRVDQASFQVYGGPFTLQGLDGEATLEFRAVDQAGQVEEVNRLRLWIDESPPELGLDRPQQGGVYLHDRVAAETHPLSVEVGGSGVRVNSTSADTVDRAVAAGNLTVEASATDAGSGVDEVRFYVDGELRFTDPRAPFEWTWPTGSESDGRHQIVLESEDRLGNLAETAPLDVEVLPSGTAGEQTTEQGEVSLAPGDPDPSGSELGLLPLDPRGHLASR